MMRDGKWRSLFIPNIAWPTLRRALMLALFGALAAGGFGILHDQITYTLSPEYFTQMKFEQFRGADFGFPDRIFVAEIGFLATWWVGWIAAWFLARIAIPRFANPEKQVVRAIIAIMGVTLAFGVLGYFLGPTVCAKRFEWDSALESMAVRDMRAFYQVAGIHLGSYAGAILGWILMMVLFLRGDSGGLFSSQE